MKLYYAPWACSLASHISLHEAGIPAEFERVDLKTKRTESGADFTAINPKGYVPALVLDSGEMLTETVAVLTWIAGRAPSLMPKGPLGQIRLIEALTFISTELHRSFKSFWHPASEAERARAAAKVSALLQQISAPPFGSHMFGSTFSVADAYLFVMLAWARRFDIATPEILKDFHQRMMARDSVRTAMTEEGLGVVAR